jgi:hypothetical protein
MVWLRSASDHERSTNVGAGNISDAIAHIMHSNASANDITEPTSRGDGSINGGACSTLGVTGTFQSQPRPWPQRANPEAARTRTQVQGGADTASRSAPISIDACFGPFGSRNGRIDRT